MIYVDTSVTYFADNSRWVLFFAFAMRKRKMLRRKFIGIRVQKVQGKFITDNQCILCADNVFTKYIQRLHYGNENYASQSYTLYEDERSIDVHLAAVAKNNEI